MCGTRLRRASPGKASDGRMRQVAWRGSLYSASPGERSGPWSNLMPPGLLSKAPGAASRSDEAQAGEARRARSATRLSRSLHSLAAAADRECYTFIRRFSAIIRRFSAMIGRLTNRHLTRRRSTCRRFSVAARAPRKQRLSDLCAPQRALDRQAREDELKFKSRQQAWPSSPDAGSPGQVASLRGSETFVVPPRCSTA